MHSVFCFGFSLLSHPSLDSFSLVYPSTRGEDGGGGGGEKKEARSKQTKTSCFDPRSKSDFVSPVLLNPLSLSLLFPPRLPPSHSLASDGMNYCFIPKQRGKIVLWHRILRVVLSSHSFLPLFPAPLPASPSVLPNDFASEVATVTVSSPGYSICVCVCMLWLLAFCMAIRWRLFAQAVEHSFRCCCW